MSDALAVILAAVLGAAAAIAGSFVTARFLTQESERDRAQEALEWMTGETQRRNVGIAAIEASWRPDPDPFQRFLAFITIGGLGHPSNRQFRRLVTPVLCGTALYLLQGSKREAAVHEVFNLRRIMDLLMATSAVERSEFEGGFEAVRSAISYNLGPDEPAESGQSRPPGMGLSVERDDLRKWRLALMKEGATAASAADGPPCGAALGSAQI